MWQSEGVNEKPKMANIASRIGTRNTPEFPFWILCILIISAPCISANCLHTGISVSLYPEGNINVKYGEPMEVFCIVDGEYTASDIHFVFGGNAVEGEILNSTTRRLYMQMPEKQITTLYCRNTKTKKMCAGRVIVDSPPSDITDFNCLSLNLETLNCSWTSPKSSSAIKYKLNFIFKNDLRYPPCIPAQFISTRYCVWNTTSFPRYRQQDEKLLFTINSCNAFGCHRQNFTIDHFSIVKPDRLIYLRVLNRGAHNALLKWRIPNNIADLLICGVEHHIQYQIGKVDNSTYFRSVDTSHLPTRNNTYRFLLTDLPYANMQYQVRISIKSNMAKSGQFWSDYIYEVFTTASEEPLRPPDTMQGAFDQYTYSNERVINIYWQDIEEIEMAGPNFTYLVQISQGNKTEMIHQPRGMSYLSINATQDALHMTVWSNNINGSSHNSSHMYIPPEKDTRSLKVTSFSKVVYENGTYELSWDSVKNIDSYTLFWCEHNGDQICNGRINFAVLDSIKTRHVIDLPIDYKYQFAISAICGKNSGGMTWAKIYSAHLTNNVCDCSRCITDHQNEKINDMSIVPVRRR